MSIGISAAALAISANAQNTANAAKALACKAQILSYNAASATVQQMKEYADCVTLLYPSEVNSLDTLFLKVLIFLTFVGGAWGGYSAYRETENLLETIVGAFLGALIAVVGSSTVYLVLSTSCCAIFI